MSQSLYELAGNEYIYGEWLMSRLDELENKMGEECTDDEIKELTEIREVISNTYISPEALRRDGILFISESVWIEYVRELVTEVGYISEDFPWWIEECISWGKVAKNVSMDYTEVEIAGHTYYVRE